MNIMCAFVLLLSSICRESLRVEFQLVCNAGKYSACCPSRSCVPLPISVHHMLQSASTADWRSLRVKKRHIADFCCSLHAV